MWFPSDKGVYFHHFSSRLAERYGIIATDKVRSDIVAQIQNNDKHTRVNRINNQRSIHCVFIERQYVYVVYRKNKADLITALPPSPKLRDLHQREKEKSIIVEFV